MENYDRKEGGPKNKNLLEAKLKSKNRQSMPAVFYCLLD
jgi:hypothetical protein